LSLKSIFFWKHKILITEIVADDMNLIKNSEWPLKHGTDGGHLHVRNGVQVLNQEW
jgi:hypothetical protein